MRFCKYEDLERLVRDYSDGMFSLIFPKLNSREKSLKCIEKVFTAYIDESPRLRSTRAEEKWLIKRLRKESGFNRLANTYEGEGLSFIELDNMLTSLRVQQRGKQAEETQVCFVELVCGDNSRCYRGYRRCAGNRIL